jgi:hypothetical protein
MVGMVDMLIERQRLTRESVWEAGIDIPGPTNQAERGDGHVVNPTSCAEWRTIPLARSLQRLSNDRSVE